MSPIYLLQDAGDILLCIELNCEQTKNHMIPQPRFLHTSWRAFTTTSLFFIDIQSFKATTGRVHAFVIINVLMASTITEKPNDKL